MSGTARRAKESRGAVHDDATRVARWCGAELDLAVVSVPLGLPPELARELTDSEREVCARLLLGQSNQQIASARMRAERTVANQVQAIYRKLAVGSRAELAALVASHQRGPSGGR